MNLRAALFLVSAFLLAAVPAFPAAAVKSDLAP